MITQDFLMCALHGAHPAGDLRSSKSVPDRFVRQWAPATESIAVALVEGQIVRTDNLHGDSRPQGCAQGWAQ